MPFSMRFLSTACPLAAVAVLTSAAALGEPLPDPDNGPISGVYNFVDSTEGADLVADGKFAFSLSSITSSHSVLEERGAESLIFDGETTRLEWRLRYGLSERIELGVELPWVWHSPGRLDSLIDTWHDVFGLPDGFRDDLPEDVLLYRYTDSSGTRLDYRDGSSGIGDLRLQAALRLGSGDKHRRALRFGLVLPTGDAYKPHGSDALSVSAGIAGDIDALGEGSRFSAFYRAHLSWIDEPALLPDRYREWIGHVAGGLGYRLNRTVDLRAQIAMRTATHDSELLVLGEPSIALTFGGNIRLGKRYTLSLAVGEDIKVNSSPDVSFMLALHFTPDDD
ncbi:MAG: DUF3187 family protein [Pseudomonadota bacterium]